MLTLMLGHEGGAISRGDQVLSPPVRAARGNDANGASGGWARCARRSPRLVSITARATAWNSMRSAWPIMSVRSRKTPPGWCFHMRHGPSSSSDVRLDCTWSM